MMNWKIILISFIGSVNLIAQDIGLHVNQGATAFDPLSGYTVLGDLAGDYLAFDPTRIQSWTQSVVSPLYINVKGGNLILGFRDNVGIGTAVPNAKLHVFDDANAIRVEYNNRKHAYISIYEAGEGRRAWLGFSSNEADDLYFTNEHSGNIVLYNNPGFLEITQEGRLYTNVNGLRDIGDKKNMQYNSATGEIGYDNSSRRYKTNIQTLKDDWSKILRARPVRYNRPDSPNHWEYGYVAEEIDSIGLTNLVGYDEQGIPDDVKYDRMVLYLTELVNAQQQNIDVLLKQNALLEKRVNKLEREVYE